jgi:hypothetical protein
MTRLVPKDRRLSAADSRIQTNFVDGKDTVSLGIESVSRCRVASVTWLILVSSRRLSRNVSN